MRKALTLWRCAKPSDEVLVEVPWHILDQAQRELCNLSENSRLHSAGDSSLSSRTSLFNMSRKSQLWFQKAFVHKSRPPTTVYGSWRINMDEIAELKGHFPGNPILPGVFQIECAIQLAIVGAKVHQQSILQKLPLTIYETKAPSRIMTATNKFSQDHSISDEKGVDGACTFQVNEIQQIKFRKLVIPNQELDMFAHVQCLQRESNSNIGQEDDQGNSSSMAWNAHVRGYVSEQLVMELECPLDVFHTKC